MVWVSELKPNVTKPYAQHQINLCKEHNHRTAENKKHVLWISVASVAIIWVGCSLHVEEKQYEVVF